MNKTKIAIAVATGIALAVGGFFIGQRRAHQQMVAEPAPAVPGSAERKALYYHDPMYPQQKFDKPGKSPFMDMQLVPVYANDKGGEGGVTVSARAQQNLGMRTALAEVMEFRQEMPAVGTVQADERRIARAEVRTAGWVEKLHVRAVNDAVRAGQVLAEIYSPELLAAQEEYLLARRMVQANAAEEPLARAGRRRLELMGLADGEIRKLEQSGTASRRVPLVAPISGIVSELGVREGAMVQAGAPAFTLTDLSSVWIVVEVPEAQGALLRPGLRAEVSVQTVPGKTFEGKLDYVYPELNAQTRTLKARIALANPRLELKPGMFVTAALVSAARKVLAVPTEAVIQTGTRSVVIVMAGERFRAATVKAGAEMAGRTEILEGLKPGERVVSSGQFLIDSESSLKGALDRLEGPAETPSKGRTHQGRGKVIDIDAAKGRVELDHEPIPSMKWPQMKMGFGVADKAALAKLKKGDAVEFDLRGEPDKDGNYLIEKIAPRSAK
ncbi:MAG: efflux RND transporter periplasmic adaptor subunit [Pseudomonadota bacterium]